MMAELAESEPVYSLLPWIKNYLFSRDCVIAFVFRKGKTVNLGVPSSERYPLSWWENPAYGRHWISQCVQIVAVIQWNPPFLHWLALFGQSYNFERDWLTEVDLAWKKFLRGVYKHGGEGQSKPFWQCSNMSNLLTGWLGGKGLAQWFGALLKVLYCWIPLKEF